MKATSWRTHVVNFLNILFSEATQNVQYNNNTTMCSIASKTHTTDDFYNEVDLQLKIEHA